jgi:FAD/FMN-containing dehydrogenase
MAGAIQTGTHGTGRGQKNIEAMLIGGRFVNGRGDIVDFSEKDGDLLRAARVSLGALGIFTRLTVRLLPAYQLESESWGASWREAAGHIDRFMAENRHFDFYWYPRSDTVQLRMMNAPYGGTRAVPFARKLKSTRNWAHLAIPKHSNLPYRYEEMEYMLPAQEGLDCFAEVRRRILERHRKQVCWRVLVRTIAADDAWLSPAFGRDTVSISLHQNSSLPYQDYFNDIEPVFRRYGGRPHWAKKHALRAEDLRPLYPKMDRFIEVRRRADPEGVFLNPYLCGLLDVQVNRPSGEKQPCPTSSA